MTCIVFYSIFQMAVSLQHISNIEINAMKMVSNQVVCYFVIFSLNHAFFSFFFFRQSFYIFLMCFSVFPSPSTTEPIYLTTRSLALLLYFYIFYTASSVILKGYSSSCRNPFVFYKVREVHYTLIATGIFSIFPL